MPVSEFSGCVGFRFSQLVSPRQSYTSLLMLDLTWNCLPPNSPWLSILTALSIWNWALGLIVLLKPHGIVPCHQSPLRQGQQLSTIPTNRISQIELNRTSWCLPCPWDGFPIKRITKNRPTSKCLRIWFIDSTLHQYSCPRYYLKSYDLTTRQFEQLRFVLYYATYSFLMLLCFARC